MRAIVDTGPLVAFFDRSEKHHTWVADRIEELEAPLLVCEAVLTEAAYLLGAHPKAQDTLLDFVQTGALSLSFRVDEHTTEIRKLLNKYRDTPMSLADACVVRMAELHETHSVFTLDSDFATYRKHGRTPLSLIHPK